MSIRVDINKINPEVGMIVESNKETIFGDKIQGVITSVVGENIIIDWYDETISYPKNELNNFNINVILNLSKYEDVINESEEDND